MVPPDELKLFAGYAQAPDELILQPDELTWAPDGLKPPAGWAQLHAGRAQSAAGQAQSPPDELFRPELVRRLDPPNKLSFKKHCFPLKICTKNAG